MAERSLVSVSATVDYRPPGGPWKPFGDLISLDRMSVTFTAIGPLSSPVLETSIEARATLANGISTRPSSSRA